MYAEHLLAHAHMTARREAADRRRRTADARRAARPTDANGVRVAVGQLLVRTGERLSGTSPGHA